MEATQTVGLLANTSQPHPSPALTESQNNNNSKCQQQAATNFNKQQDAVYKQQVVEANTTTTTNSSNNNTNIKLNYNPLETTTKTTSNETICLHQTSDGPCNSNGSSSSLSSSSLNNNATSSSSANASKDLEQLAKETQEFKSKTRKLQLEIEEKNEIINVLKDELETTKEQNDKFQRENIQLLKDSKRVNFLQDENDFLQDKVGNLDKLELEIKRLKEKLAELDFLKLRINELEEDKARAQEESNVFEAKFKEAEIKLKRVAELEAELNKWKSFGNELEVEKNIIQTKLLESIEQETKLNSINKKVEDEVKRLRTLIKSYEEQRDEEQASNSLILSVADLRQLDQQTSLQQQHDLLSDTSITETLSLAETSIKFELDKQLEKELKEENRVLKQKFNEQEEKLLELDKTNRSIRDELDGNRKLISDLRQDLACEKSLAVKLANQLNSFTKQIKNLDKQYFPIHDTTSSTSLLKEKNETKEAREEVKQQRPRQQQKETATLNEGTEKELSANKLEVRNNCEDELEVGRKNDSGFQSINNDFNQSSALTTEVQMPAFTSTVIVSTIKEKAAIPVELPAVTSTLAKTKATTVRPVDNKEKVESAKPNPSTQIDSLNHVETATGQEQITGRQSSSTTPTQSKDQVPSSDLVLGQITDGSQKRDHKPSTAKTSAIQGTGHETNDSDDDNNNNSVAKQKRAPTPVKSARSPSLNSNFVRNSLPSRSVNFGHSKSSAYLDRIRASVTATTTTNTHSSSFNEQTKNCAQQTSQLVAGEPLRNHSSRQVNALVDQVPHERLMMSMLQHQQIHHTHQGHVGAQNLHHSHPKRQQHFVAPLTETDLTQHQLAHLANLHHQHYYHHLQHMHQLHQMHHHQHHMHLHHHRMHHKYQHSNDSDTNEVTLVSASNERQLQQQQQQVSKPNHQVPQPIYSGGSQFYAPTAQMSQVYANTAELNQQHQVTRLVKNNNSHNQQQLLDTTGGVIGSSPSSSDSRQNVCRVSPSKTHQLNNYALPQIDEINGLPSAPSHLGAISQHVSQRRQQRSAQVVMTSEASSNKTATQQDLSSNGLPPSSSSSPTSSTSSNLSVSSAASSSSSLNSLSTSGAPLNRSALRHTTTNLSRRQFSVERELIGSLPMTATLSRVGSCRVATSRPSNNLNSSFIEPQTLRQQKEECPQMRTPVKSQQPPMRTSKILNIGQQVAPTTATSSTLHQKHQQQQQALPNALCNRSLSVERSGIERLASNLANIRLSDGLAFNSLRAPKSASGNNNNTNGSSPSGKMVTSSNQEKRKQQQQPINGATNDNNSANKSSVWFEYGCV